MNIRFSPGAKKTLLAGALLCLPAMAAEASPPQAEPVAGTSEIPAADAAPDRDLGYVAADDGGARIYLAQGDTVPPSLPARTGAAPPAGLAGGPAAGAPGGPPGAPGGMPPGMPPISVILGYADFMLAIDRPYEAEKIYLQIQSHLPKLDPNDPKVQEMMKHMPKEAIEGMQKVQAAVTKGLADVAYAKRPTMTVLGHSYTDDHDVKLYAYGAGPTFRYKWGRATFTTGTGHYSNNNNPNNPNNPLSISPDIPSAADNDTLRKDTYNLLLEPYYGKWEGNFFLSQVNYDAAPDRSLYDFKVSYVPNPARERFYLSTGRHDSYFQNVNNQFYAPETFFQLQRKIIYDDYSFGAEVPLAERLDATFYARYFEYSDGNRRNNYRSQLMYRIKPNKGKQMPVWRVGLDFIFDDSKFFTLDYTASENFNAYSVATDYMWISRKLKYGFYASYAVADQNFHAPNSVFSFASYQLSKGTELYAKQGQLAGTGNSLTFRDYVIGVNQRF